ncbi:MAG: hypothetical protein ACJAQ0_001340, partial [Dasania sp.]
RGNQQDVALFYKDSDDKQYNNKIMLLLVVVDRYSGI